MIRFWLLLSLAAVSVDAQVSGKWSATFDADISMSNGTPTVKKRMPATLALTQRGDSIMGTWAAGSLETVAVRGTFDGRALHLTTGPNEREVRINGQPTKMKVRTDWSGSLQGDRLSGTMFIYIGEREPPPRAWEAKKD